MKNLKWGTKVRTTELAVTKNIFPKHRKGICLGWAYGRFNQHTPCLVVVCEGQVTPRKYHPDFWKVSS